MGWFPTVAVTGGLSCPVQHCILNLAEVLPTASAAKGHRYCHHRERKGSIFNRSFVRRSSFPRMERRGAVHFSFGASFDADGVDPTLDRSKLTSIPPLPPIECVHHIHPTGPTAGPKGSPFSRYS